MADPNLELDEGLNMDRGQFIGPSAQPGSPPPPETPGEQSAVESHAASSGALPVGVTGDLKAAFGRMNKPVLPPRSEVAQPTVKKPPTPSEIMGAAIRNKPAKALPETIPPARHYTKWGDPPDQPPPPLHQVPNIFHAIGNWFKNTNLGSATDQLLGGHLMEQSDRYVHEFMWGKNAAADFHHKQMMYAHQELVASIGDRLLRAKEIMAGDPKEIISRLHALARETGDVGLEYQLTISGGGAKAAVKYLEQMEKYWQSLNLSGAQVEKQTQIDTNQDRFYHPDDWVDPTSAPKPGGKPPSDSAAGNADGLDPGVLDGAAPTPQPEPGRLGQQPPPAPPAAPGAPAPYEIQTTPDTRPTGSAAPDGQGVPLESGGAPGDVAAIAQASPPEQGIQVAGDDPRSWAGLINKIPPNVVAQADTTPAATTPPPDDSDWVFPPEDPNLGRSATGHVIQYRRGVRNWAIQELENPGYLNQQKSTMPDAAASAMQMANQIRANFRDLENSNRPSGPWVIRAINKQVPGLGNLVKGIAEGKIDPPPRGQMYGTRGSYGRMVAGLVAKYDPTMLAPGAYESRAAAQKYWGTGPGGALMRDQGATYLHGWDLIDALEGMRGTTRFQRGWAGTDPPFGAGDWMRKYNVYPSVEIGKRVEDVRRAAEIFFDEAQGVFSKGKPTQTGIKRSLEGFNIESGNVDVLEESVRATMKGLREKMKENISWYHAGTGWAGNKLDELFQGYIKQGDPLARSIHNQIIDSPDDPRGPRSPSGSSSPRAQAPGEPSREDLLDWAKQNPNNPKSQEILRRLNQ